MKKSKLRVTRILTSNWRNQEATFNQRDLLRCLGLECPHFKGDASDLISKTLKERNLKLVGKAVVKKKKIKPGLTLTSAYRLAHGFYGLPFVKGAIHYSHGVMDYVDDGHGNEWHLGDDDFYDDMPEY